MRIALLVIHIAAAATWLGASVTQMAVAPTLTGKSSEVASAWMAASMRLSQRLYPIAGALVLLAGVGLVLVSDVYSFADLFVTVGFTVVILGGALGGMVFTPVARRAAEAYSSGNAVAGRAASVRILRFGLIDIALLVVAITAMVAKWGL